MDFSVKNKRSGYTYSSPRAVIIVGYSFVYYPVLFHFAYLFIFLVSINLELPDGAKSHKLLNSIELHLIGLHQFQFNWMNFAHFSFSLIL